MALVADFPDLDGRHPGLVDLVQDFDAEHLGEPMQTISLYFQHLAAALLRELPDGPRLTKCVESLLYAKDLAVRHTVRTLTDGNTPGEQDAGRPDLRSVPTDGQRSQNMIVTGQFGWTNDRHYLLGLVRLRRVTRWRKTWQLDVSEPPSDELWSMMQGVLNNLQDFGLIKIVGNDVVLTDAGEDGLSYWNDAHGAAYVVADRNHSAQDDA